MFVFLVQKQTKEVPEAKTKKIKSNSNHTTKVSKAKAVEIDFFCEILSTCPAGCRLNDAIQTKNSEEKAQISRRTQTSKISKALQTAQAKTKPAQNHDQSGQRGPTMPSKCSAQVTSIFQKNCPKIATATPDTTTRRALERETKTDKRQQQPEARKRPNTQNRRHKKNRRKRAPPATDQTTGRNFSPRRKHKRKTGKDKATKNRKTQNEKNRRKRKPETRNRTHRPADKEEQKGTSQEGEGASDTPGKKKKKKRERERERKKKKTREDATRPPRQKQQGKNKRNHILESKQVAKRSSHHLPFA